MEIFRWVLPTQPTQMLHVAPYMQGVMGFVDFAWIVVVWISLYIEWVLFMLLGLFFNPGTTNLRLWTTFAATSQQEKIRLTEQYTP